MPLDSIKLGTREEIGRGGFGKVFRVQHKYVDAVFALKVLDPWGGQESGSHRERFFREAQILFDLFHPNIVRVFGVGLLEDRPCILMELVKGRTLQEELAAAGRIRPERALQIVKEIAAGLSHAHTKVIHRDLKPGNVMIDEDGRVRILDFGLGVYIEEDLVSRITKTGELVVGGHYTAPELLATPRLREPHVDIFSVGAIWFELLTGRVPVGTGIEKALDEEVTIRPQERGILLRCLDSAAGRYATAAELLRELEGATPRVISSTEDADVARASGKAISQEASLDKPLQLSVELSEPEITAAQEFACQVVQKEQRFWSFGWKIVLQNLSRSDSRYRIECRFINAQGQELTSTPDNPGIVLRPGESKAFPGRSVVEVAQARQVRSVLALVSRRPVVPVPQAVAADHGMSPPPTPRAQRDIAMSAWKQLQVALGQAVDLVSPMQNRPDFQFKLRTDEDVERYLQAAGFSGDEIAMVMRPKGSGDRDRAFARIEDARRLQRFDGDFAAFQNFVIDNEPLFDDSVSESLIERGKALLIAMLPVRLALREPHVSNLEDARNRSYEKVAAVRHVEMAQLKRDLRAIPGIGEPEPPPRR